MGVNDDADDPLTSAILGSSAVALFENVYAAYAHEARRTAAAFLGDGQLAADAVHNAYVEILRYLLGGGRWAAPAEARGVVLRNARWAALNILRSRRRRPESALESAGNAADAPDDAAWARWEARALCEQIVARLRPEQREALALHFRDGLSNPEAAQRVGLTPSGFAARLHRALAAARRVARGSEMLPGVAGSGAIGWRRARRAVAAATSCAKLSATGVAAVLVLYGVAGLGGASPDRGGAGSSAVMAPVVAGRGNPVLISDVVVVDAVAVRSDARTDVVLALGWLRSCSCWVVARTSDAGAHWTTSPGPAAHSPAARLEVAAAYPHDPRIVIVDGSARTTTTWISPRFGAPFEASRTAIPVSRAAHMTAARTLQAAGHLISFPPLGGARCSADGGSRWQSRCGT